MWEYIFGGATIFGVIVGSFSVYNSRATRRYIGELIKETKSSISELIKEGGRLTRELMDRYMEMHGEVLRKYGEVFEKICEQHGAMLRHGEMLINLLKKEGSDGEG